MEINYFFLGVFCLKNTEILTLSNDLNIENSIYSNKKALSSMMNTSLKIGLLFTNFINLFTNIHCNYKWILVNFRQKPCDCSASLSMLCHRQIFQEFGRLRFCESVAFFICINFNTVLAVTARIIL